MRYDGHDGARLPSEAEQRLEALWRQLILGGTVSVRREDLCSVAQLVGPSARGTGLLPEALIVAIKESWRVHGPAYTGKGDRADARSVVTDLISLCVSEYFQDFSRARHHDATAHGAPDMAPSSHAG